VSEVYFDAVGDQVLSVALVVADELESSQELAGMCRALNANLAVEGVIRELHMAQVGLSYEQVNFVAHVLSHVYMIKNMGRRPWEMARLPLFIAECLRGREDILEQYGDSELFDIHWTQLLLDVEAARELIKLTNEESVLGGVVVDLLRSTNLTPIETLTTARDIAGKVS
jgi:hypothetical protein